MKLPRLIFGACSAVLGATAYGQSTDDGVPWSDLAKDTDSQPHVAFRRAAPPEPFAGIPLSRESSGTSWQPDSTPTIGEYLVRSDWRLMFVTNVFPNYDAQSGPRGTDQFNSVNWLTLSGQHSVGDSELSLRATFSLDVESSGSAPVLFQTGETYRGAALVDRQSKDFFMELAARYRRNLGNNRAAFAYLAAAGAPALGPTSFTYRASAMANPAAPSSQQWLDSTQVSFGVATVGVSQGRWQVEGSCFNGREDFNRDGWGLGLSTLNSFAGRVSFNPTRNWSLQVSTAVLHEPEAFDRTASQHRITASMQHHRRLSGRASVATTIAVGRNALRERETDAFLAETAWNTGRGCTLFGRAEYVEKLGRQLAVSPREEKFPLKTLTLGASHDFTPNRPFSVAVGGACTYTFTPSELDRFYGDHPVGLLLFVRVSPGRKIYAVMD
jgi:hypothetical protein